MPRDPSSFQWILSAVSPPVLAKKWRSLPLAPPSGTGPPISRNVSRQLASPMRSYCRSVPLRNPSPHAEPILNPRTAVIRHFDPSFFRTNRRGTLFKSVTAPRTVLAPSTIATFGVMNRMLPLTTYGTVISLHVSFIPITILGGEEHAI